MININMKTVAKVLIAGFVIVGGTTVVAKSARIDTNTPLYFKGAFDATPEDYYILKDDKQNEYFINKKQIEDAIKRSIANIEQTEGVMTGDGYMNLAIKIDKKGNPEVLTAEEATKEENVIKLNNYGVKYTVDEKKNTVHVQSGMIKMKADISDIRLLGGQKSPKKQTGGVRTVHTGSSKVTASSNSSIDIRGKTVEEAMLDLDTFIDNILRTGLNEITIIHGKGTGALRKGIHIYLRKHPNIRTFRLGVFGEGEDGVTIAELK